MNVRRAVLSIETMGATCWPGQERLSHALLPLGRKTVLQVLLDELTAAGAEEICILIGQEDQSVRQYVRTLVADGLLVASDRDEFAGTALPISVQCMTGAHKHSLPAARHFVGDEPFMYASTEMPIYHKHSSGSLLRRMCVAHEATGADGVVAVREHRGSNPSSRTVVEAVGNPQGSPHFVVANLADAPLVRDERSGDGLIGRYILSPIIFDYLEEQRSEPDEECNLIAALRRLAHAREALWAVRVQGGEFCFDLSSFLLYSRTFIHFSLEDPEVGAAVRDYLSNLVLS